MRKLALLAALLLTVAGAVGPGFSVAQTAPGAERALPAALPSGVALAESGGMEPTALPVAEKENRLPTGLVAPAVVGALFYRVISLAVYLFFGLVLLGFLGLMLLLGRRLRGSPRRRGWALAALLAAAMAGSTGIVLWMVRTLARVAAALAS